MAAKDYVYFVLGTWYLVPGTWYSALGTSRDGRFGGEALRAGVGYKLQQVMLLKSSTVY